MPYKLPKSILLTHSDLDAIAVVILVHYFELPFEKIVGYDYGFEKEASTVQVLYDSDEIVIADLSLTPELYNNLIRKGKDICIFDHHETSQWIKDKENCVWDSKRSGAKIFFDEYVKPRVGRYKPVVEEFVNLVDVYDRWDLESPLRPSSEDLQRVFVRMGEWNLEDNVLRHEIFIKEMLRKLQTTDHFKWTAVELMHIRDAKLSEEKAYVEAMNMLQIRKDNKGRRFGVFSAWGKISMTCHRMLNVDNLDVDYIICAQTFHNKLGQMSLRSREGQFDLMELAGVNGHKASAGAMLTADEVIRFLNENMCFKYKTDLKTEGEGIIEYCL